MSRCRPASGICTTGTNARQGPRSASRSLVLSPVWVMILRTFGLRLRKRPGLSEPHHVAFLIERFDRSYRIGGQPPRAFDVPAIQDVLADCARKRLGTAGERHVIGGGAAIKGLAQRLHLLWYREVPNGHFPQI